MVKPIPIPVLFRFINRKSKMCSKELRQSSNPYVSDPEPVFHPSQHLAL